MVTPPYGQSAARGQGRRYGVSATRTAAAAPRNANSAIAQRLEHLVADVLDPLGVGNLEAVDILHVEDVDRAGRGR